MFVHNLSPVIFSIGPVAIRWYGLVYVLGFIGAYFGFKRFGGLTAKEADSVTLWLIIGLLVGARGFFFAFYRPDLFSPLEFFAVWNGGMSFHGALVGLMVALWLWSRKNGKDVWHLADVGALVSAFFLALGRVANFVNAEIVGTRFDGAWCVMFPGYEDCRHPVQLYAMVKNLIIGGILVLIWKTKKFAPGFIFWVFCGLYGIFRFTVNTWRDDPIILFGWMKMGQILSLVLFVVALVVLLTFYRNDFANLFKRSTGKKK